jgi:hypothetical protein
MFTTTYNVTTTYVELTPSQVEVVLLYDKYNVVGADKFEI